MSQNSIEANEENERTKGKERDNESKKNYDVKKKYSKSRTSR